MQTVLFAKMQSQIQNTGHPAHENDSPPPPRTTFGNRNGSRSFSRGSADAIQLKVGNEYVDITEISRQQGDGIPRIQGYMIFVKGGKIGRQVKIMITEIRSRFAIARTA
jgi:predicted RNA-binding protein with TRAM domain